MKRNNPQFKVGDVVGVRPHGLKEIRLYGRKPQHGQKAKQTGKILAIGFFKSLVAYGKVQRWHFTSELWNV